MEDNRARDQAKAQLEGIMEMVKALNVDYDRLEELKSSDDVETLDELGQLILDSNGCENREEAEQVIQEDPLSVQVRSGWFPPDWNRDAWPDPEEFEILLCTGGPAVRIIGDLPPNRAWIQYQDWLTPWTNYPLTSEEESAVLEYCQQFYFGD